MKNPCNIPMAKSANHRLLVAFDELPEVSKAEGVEHKMQPYLDMYRKPPSPKAIEALCALADIWKSKVGLAGCS